MNPIIQQTLYFMGSYIAIIFFFFFSINWLTKGWLSCYLKVKTSRGKKIMTHVLSKTDTYYRPGYFEKSTYKYKTRDKKKQSLTEIKRGDLWYEGGVHHILVDEDTGSIYPYASQNPIKAGITPGTADEMTLRAITAPTQDDNFRKMLLAVMVIMVIGLIILAFTVWDTKQAVMEIGKISGVI